jgi:hypothetical protein
MVCFRGQRLATSLLIFQIVEFHLDAGVGAFVLLSRLLPDRQDLGIGLNVEDLITVSERAKEESASTRVYTAKI